MKNKIHTTGLLLLMTLSTFGAFAAGTPDSTKKDTCCTMKDTRTPAVGTNDKAATLPEVAQVAASLQDLVAAADAEITFHYTASQAMDKSQLEKVDALTNVEMQVALMEASFNKSALASAKLADKAITATYKKAVSLDIAAFQPENVAKMLMESDKMMNQLYAQHCGMEVAIVK